MSFANPPTERILELLRAARTIAVVGLSDQPARTSHGVAAALQGWGYRIVPVNPAIASALGEPAFATLDAAVAAAGAGGIDIVNVFRRPEHVAGIVDDCIRLGLRRLWLQEGVVDEVAAERARAAGIEVVMDLCIFKLRAALD